MVRTLDCDCDLDSSLHFDDGHLQSYTLHEPRLNMLLKLLGTQCPDYFVEQTLLPFNLE